MSEVSIATMADGAPEKSLTRPKLSVWQYIAAGILIGEACLLPIALILFVIARSLGNTFIGVLPSLWVLHKQYALLIGDGFDPFLIAVSLRLFELMIRLSVPVVLLRLISGPLLFSQPDVQHVYREKLNAPVKLCLVLLLFTSGIWVCLQIQSTHSLLLRMLLTLSPYWYICLDTLVFIVALMFSVEAFLALIELILMRAREGTRSQPPSSEKDTLE
jgi:hypothetical protein